ncbi:MAG: PAS domain-containing protein [Chloroflexaceae bacterium]|nr:PAS domain-containing protein [Chloroflexaceae bacterium]NJL33554.1 PAS domain-containing protein [Chloroflexaceae bacterium]NJO05402.1 PAS domain-containing protein [Chloroflexaceae bacterium]
MHSTVPTVPNLQAEIVELRRQLEELEHSNAALQHALEQQSIELSRNYAFLQGFMQNSPVVMFMKDLHGRYMMVNDHYIALLKRAPDEVIGKTTVDIYPSDIAQQLRSNDREVVLTRQTITVEEVLLIDNEPHIFSSVKFPIFDDDGEVHGIGVVAIDITNMQQQVVEAQRNVLRQLSTPLLPIADHVVMMPLIGGIDAERAQQMTETLLEGIAMHRAAVAILDITGVQEIDTQIADNLIRAAQAAQLLGAELILSGIRPRIAQTLVELGVDLRTIITYSTLQAAIAAALRRSRKHARYRKETVE